MTMNSDRRGLPLDLYCVHYHEHLTHVRAHLSGDDGNSLPPSYIPPTGYWSSAEKNVFFHALSVHSRLRPDLIAACIRTKTVVEVCAYIDMLDQATTHHSVNSLRMALPCAMEVSDAWVQLEEKASLQLAAQEPEWEEGALQKARDIEMKTIQVTTSGAAVENGWTRRRQRVELINWKERMQDKYSREDVLRRLDEPHLRALESIFRDDEDGAPAEVSPEPQSLPKRLRSDSGEPIPHQTSSPSARTVSHSPVSTSTPLVLDMNALPTGTADTLSVMPDSLSPASRRRYKKRLYMRRKRAEASGAQVIPDTVRLKPGRKQTKKSQKEAEPEAAWNKDPDNDPHFGSRVSTEEGGQSDNEEEYPYHPGYSGGRTTHHKIKDKLAEVHIDAPWLRTNGHSLINLRSIGKHMRMYRSHHNARPEVASRISADTIQFLDAHLKHFITDLCHRAIVSREQEAERKTHTKVWHFRADQLPISNVEHASEMMGFIALLERTNQYSKDISQGIEAKQDSEGRHRNDREPDSDNDDIGGAPVVVEEIPSFTIHREMYPPLVRLPPRLCPSSFSRARSPPQAHPSPTTLAEDLLPLETDEDALAAEFVEEEELDALDVKDEVTYEQALWECPQGTETASV